LTFGSPSRAKISAASWLLKGRVPSSKAKDVSAAVFFFSIASSNPGRVSVCISKVARGT